MNVLALQSDYPILSLTRLSAPVKIIERVIVDLEVVEALEGTLVEEEQIVSPLVTEEEIQGTVVDEEELVSTMTTEEQVTGSLTEEETMVGVLECDGGDDE